MYEECEASRRAGAPQAGLARLSLLLGRNQLRLPRHRLRAVLALVGVSASHEVSIDEIKATARHGKPDKGQSAAVLVEASLRFIKFERDALTVEECFGESGGLGTKALHG